MLGFQSGDWGLGPRPRFARAMFEGSEVARHMRASSRDVIARLSYFNAVLEPYFPTVWSTVRYPN